MPDETLLTKDGQPARPWGQRGRPPKSAAGTYTPLSEIVKPPGPGRGRGGVVTANRGGKYQPIIAPDARAAARAIYEATPGATVEMVGKELGGHVPEGTLRRWKAADGWKSAARTIPDLAGRAGQLANTFRLKMSELGKPLDDKVAADEVAKEVSTQHAVDIRAGVLDRHRREWSAPRKITYDAMKKAQNGDVVGAYDLAKLGKIAAETLQIVQVGECRAFGLNEASRSADGGTVVVVERDAPLIEGEVAAPGTVSDDEVQF